jgi:hypothetical protein
MIEEQKNKPDPQPLGGHAITLGLLFPRRLGVFLLLAFAAIAGITLYHVVDFIAGLF